MKSWLKWTARLGMAGACVMAVGCGSGGVPDTSNEGQPATGGAAPAAEPKTEVASAPSEPSEPSAPKGEETAPAEASAAPAAPQAPAKKEGGSATAEMYALATTPSTGSNPSAGGAPAPGAPSSAPAAPGAPGPGGMPGGGMAAMMQGRAGMRAGGPAMGGPAGAPGGGPPGPGGMNPGMMASAMGGGMRPGMQPGQGGMAPGGMAPSDMAKMMGNRMGGGRPGMPGAPGGPAAGALGAGGGGPGGAKKPANLHTPEGAVTAFLDALKDKDLDSLNEAMALHAPAEAAERNKPIFQKICDLNLPDADLVDLAKKLVGYKILTVNPPKSTGRLDVVIQKPGERGAFVRRRVTVRHEKKGWGVVDISVPSEFKSMSNYGQRRKN